jgi:hypothetical protein
LPATAGSSRQNREEIYDTHINAKITNNEVMDKQRRGYTDENGMRFADLSCLNQLVLGGSCILHTKGFTTPHVDLQTALQGIRSITSASTNNSYHRKVPES